MIKNIYITNLLQKHNINIIDIRNKEKYNDNHIPNSINIPAEKLIQEPKKYLQKEQTYYIYCQKGITSPNICKILSNFGYDVVNIKGGYESYILNRRN